MGQRPRLSRRTAVRAAGAALVAGAALGTDMARGAAAAPQPAQEGAPSTGMIGVWVISSTRAGQIPNGILAAVHPDGSFLRIGTNHPTEGARPGRLAAGQ